MDSITEELEEDAHVLHLWEPLSFQADSSYSFLPKGLLFHLFSTLLWVIAFPLLWIFNKIVFGFSIHGVENLQRHGSYLTVSNHVHPMDCTMNAIISAPRRVFFPTLEDNFKIPVVRHLIKLLHAIPIPKKMTAKKSFIACIHTLLKTNHVVHFYPEGSLWPYHTKLRHFKEGAFRFAVECNVPITPIVYTFEKPRGIWKWYKTKPCIQATILPCIFPNTNLNSPEAILQLKEEVFHAMQTFLKEHSLEK